jgi:hypothetical protein
MRQRQFDCITIPLDLALPVMIRVLSKYFSAKVHVPTLAPNQPRSIPGLRTAKEFYSHPQQTRHKALGYVRLSNHSLASALPHTYSDQR